MHFQELEKLGAKKLRLSARNTLQAAEKLYTSGYISYPRTETNIFPKQLNLTPLVEAQTGDPRWGGEVEKFSKDSRHFIDVSLGEGQGLWLACTI